MPYTVQELRKELKAAGYKLNVKTYSDFKSGEIRAPNGDGLTGYFTPEGFAAHSARHATAFRILAKYKGQTFDGDYRVVLS